MSLEYSRHNIVRGPKIGIVTKITGDPNKSKDTNKIQVKLVSEGNKSGMIGDLELEYASVVTQYAGKKFGYVNIPQVGQPVVVDFLDGDITRPIILGCIYGPNFEPPIQIDKKNEIIYLKTAAELEVKFVNTKDKQQILITSKKGHKINIDDDKQTATISSKDGESSITTNFKNGEVIIKAKKKLTMSAGKQDKLILEDGKGLKLTSNAGKLDVNVNEVKLTAKTKVGIKGNSEAKLEGAQVAVKGQAKTEVSGATTAVKGSAMLQLN